MTIIFAILSSVAFGVANALQKTAIEKSSSIGLLISRGIIISIITGLAAIVVRDAKFDFTWILLSIICSAISYFGIYFVYKALETEKTGVVLPIALSRAIIISFVSFVFLKEDFSYSQNSDLFSAVILGTILISANFKSHGKSSSNSRDCLFDYLLQSCMGSYILFLWHTCRIKSESSSLHLFSRVSVLSEWQFIHSLY
jgi:uncharacterized membrane protein